MIRFSEYRKDAWDTALLLRREAVNMRMGTFCTAEFFLSFQVFWSSQSLHSFIRISFFLKMHSNRIKRRRRGKSDAEITKQAVFSRQTCNIKARRRVQPLVSHLFVLPQTISRAVHEKQPVSQIFMHHSHV